ncbi:MAG: histidinol dehydrogenase [Acidobacteria bacterium]|nr:histidinol dehydrogenase [Acidobacteriota bacterium]
MKIVEYPKRDEWAELLRRPVMDTKFLERTVANILADVRGGGDEALRHCSRQFDPYPVTEFEVTEEEFAEAETTVSADLKKAIAAAKANIEKFHAVAFDDSQPIEMMPGVLCWKRTLPIDKVGLYVPAGSAPLFSTVLMLAIPAAIAGCGEVIMCSPPNASGKIDPATLYAARLCGVRRVFKIGGAQAIGAMAYGTATVPAVYKIFGPGNQFVTEAKLQVMRAGVAIDMPAGPSEVAVFADDSCIPKFVAADLLSQAEHGPDSQVILVSISRKVIDDAIAQLGEQLDRLPRKEAASRAIENSKAILVDSIQTGVEILNEYAAEHLILAVRDAEDVAHQITNAGSVFIGNYSCESAGDYASGTNHTLPTGGAARAFSGVSTASFTKTITYQRLDADGIKNLAPVVETMAAAEGLEAHRFAAAVRRKSVEAKDV